MYISQDGIFKSNINITSFHGKTVRSKDANIYNENKYNPLKLLYKFYYPESPDSEGTFHIMREEAVFMNRIVKQARIYTSQLCIIICRYRSATKRRDNSWKKMLPASKPDQYSGPQIKLDKVVRQIKIAPDQILGIAR